MHSERFYQTENLRIVSSSRPSASKTTATGLPVTGSSKNTSTYLNLRFRDVAVTGSPSSPKRAGRWL